LKSLAGLGAGLVFQFSGFWDLGSGFCGWFLVLVLVGKVHSALWNRSRGRPTNIIIAHIVAFIWHCASSFHSALFFALGRFWF